MTYYSRHKKPPKAVPSPFVFNTMRNLRLDVSLPILDLACGFGRHAMYFASLGYHVVAADVSLEVFRDEWHREFHNIYPVILDASKPLPFSYQAFGVISIVHYYHPELFTLLKNYLVPGGVLIYESISGHGGNWQELDLKGEVRRKISDAFNILEYKENATGPEKQYATVKLLARRIYN